MFTSISGGQANLNTSGSEAGFDLPANPNLRHLHVVANEAVEWINLQDGTRKEAIIAPVAGAAEISMSLMADSNSGGDNLNMGSILKNVDEAYKPAA